MYDYHAVLAEHIYRGNRIKGHRPRPSRESTKTSFATAMLIAVALVVAFGNSESSMADEVPPASQIAPIDSAAGATLPQTPRVPTIELLPAPAWQPDWTALTQHRATTLDVPAFEPLLAPLWEPNWTALNEHRGN